jgi:hypothetical protein
MSQTQQSRQLYQITRSEATWLIKNYKKALKKAAEIEPYRVFRDALETQKPAYLGMFNNSQNAVVQGTFYAMALHIYNVIEKLFKKSDNENHDAKVSALCKHLPTSYPIAYRSVDYLNWAVYNWHHKKEIIREDFTDNCLENTTCAICNFTGEEVFYFSTAYGLEQPVCANCLHDEEEMEDTKDGEYVMEEESEDEWAEPLEASEAEASEAEASEADASEADTSDDDDEDYAPSEESECEEEYESASEEDESEEDESEADASEADANEASYDQCCEYENSCAHRATLSLPTTPEPEEEKFFGCSGCPYEFKQGWKTGYKAAMKEIRNYAADQKHNVPDAPECALCEDSHEDLKKCGRCESVRYCSEECQEEDWPEHKRVCRR